jgi:hypothetical protein
MNHKELINLLKELFDKENELLARLESRSKEILGSDEEWRTLTRAHNLLKQHISVVVNQIND